MAGLVLAGVFVLSGCRDRGGAKPDEMIIRQTLPSKIQTLDANNMRDVYSQTVGSQIYETLFTYHFLKRPYEIIPLLAEDMPEISEDHLTYTIRIKKGVFYQDDKCFPDGKGRELKAEDFVYTIKRIANVRYASVNWALFKDRIVGLNEFREYTKNFKKETDVDYSREVEGLAVLDDYTLRIKLTLPWPQILEIALADTSTAPVPKEAVDYYKEDIIYHPVGTGPFRLKEWQRGFYVELVRNENWRGELYPSEGEASDVEAGFLADAGKPIPFADRILWRVVEEDQPSWLLFMRGQIDGISIRKDNFSQVFADVRNMQLSEDMKQRNIRLKVFADPSVFWIGFNMQDPVLGKNLPLRRALSYAFDRVKYIEIFRNGVDQPADGFVPPMMNSYDPEIAKAGYGEYNPAKARVLMAEARRLHGGPIPPLTLAMPSADTLFRQMGDFIRSQFAQIGVELRIDYMNWPTFMESVNKGQQQMFYYGVVASVPDAMDFLELFPSKFHAPGGNKFFYSNPQYDALYEEARVMFDSPERTALYRKMERMVMDDCPAIFLSHPVAYILTHNWYKNYKPNVFSYNLMKYRHIDLEERNAYKELLNELKKKKKN